MLVLRGINFGPCIGASGIQGFFSGDEYHYHRIFKHVVPGFEFQGMTFCAKTMTIDERAGNTELADDRISIRRFRPDSIVAKFGSGVGLNAVGLSNPGAEFLLKKGIWQQRKDPFMLSFMAVAQTSTERMEETKRFTELLARHLPNFQAPIALQSNESCPNTEHGGQNDERLREIHDRLDILGQLGIPLIPKLNALVSVESTQEIHRHKFCDALCVSNTIPYGQEPYRIDWKGYFGTESPLQKYGGGGLSGRPLFPLLHTWVVDINWEWKGTRPKIIAGGGILHPEDVRILSNHSVVKAASPGSGAFLRPWRMKSIIATSHECLHKV